MNYPDGQPVRVGDHIWWDEGACVGFVQRTIESACEMEEWGVNSPSITVGNHPFSPADEGFVRLDHRCFDAEGIGCLSEVEEDEFQEALEHAMAQSEIGFEECTYSLRAEVEHHVMVAWVFQLLRKDTCIETIRVRTRASDES